jgi:hypothetical protein
MCLDYPLLRNHLSLVDLDIKHYKTNSSNFLWYPNFLGSTWVSSWKSSSFDYPNSFSFKVTTFVFSVCRGVMPHFSKRFIIYGGFQKIIFQEEFLISFFFNSWVISNTCFVKYTSLTTQQIIQVFLSICEVSHNLGSVFNFEF